MSDDRVRLFVALELPEPVRSALIRWRDGLGTEGAGALRPVSAGGLHVTLCFLGWREAEQVKAIGAACTVIARDPAPALSLGAPRWLPRRRPRVLAVELDDAEARLAALQARLSAALVAGGWYGPENRPYLAHVSVARVKGGVRGGPGELPEPPRLDFHASHVVLYRSHLSHSGARYEPLVRVRLTGPAG